MELYAQTLTQLQQKLQRREVSAMEITESVLRRIGEVDQQVGSYLLVDVIGARAQAAEADRRLAAGEAVSPVTGIPLGLKDLLSTKGMRTTCASKILEHYVPAYDATVVHRLRQAGAVLTGKLNMDEFAMGSSTENSAFQLTRNPWNLECVPGGSSGGSASAVAADECIASLGSDTGGSIRQPASFCGVVGLKPTYGRVSRYGLVAFASSLDQIGTFTKTVADAALLLSVVAGYDHHDSTSVKEPVPTWHTLLDRDLRSLTVGIPQEYFVEGMDTEVEQAVRRAIGFFADQGATIREVNLPHSDYAVATYYLVATAEASSNLARYDGVKYGYRSPDADGLLEMYCQTRSEGFGPEVKRRIMLGTYALSAGYYDAYYKKAQQVRTLIKQDFETVFSSCDIIVSPVSPTPAFRIGEKVDDPLQMYLTDILTIPVNLAGLPALSLPCGFSKSGLPIGLQMIARPFAEESLFQAAHQYEQATDWHREKPVINGSAN
ncbi:MAG: Asp-tRNA(Asn)/Glu-tRNA(Gln) amidotransferase subunit GatA [Deltaproteobacteria bacterium]|nr:Asp-tRNA(Asn)/Glu-tRNA(Gln) amidotransferase subunit GatA [Candidatus Anaeroferrophillus wilburensis]MBN2888942.1 Asp-tRNA(Asn)/Glu-tRNA(Gln) amidotransferase subunit GatA [Deltaproteobacteria bacterium]